MSTQTTKIDLPVLSHFDDQDAPIYHAAQVMGKLLFETAEYKAFLSALKAVNSNVDIQRLSAKIREHNTALQWGKGDAAEHQSALEQLDNEMEALPAMLAYHANEQATLQLCREVDLIISTSAGVEFAANAKSGGCGCGG